MKFLMIDLEICNLNSMLRAFERVGTSVEITQDASLGAAADVLILPGVGAYRDGMAFLNQRGWPSVLKNHVQAGKPLLGICLGMQLMADSSEEYGHHPGLGLVQGQVLKLKPGDSHSRIPNMGWCLTHPQANAQLFQGLPHPASFYYAHSYHFVPENSAIITAKLEFGSQFLTAAFESDNVFGFQFHPEKSQDVGLNLLHNFVLYCRSLK